MTSADEDVRLEALWNALWKEDDNGSAAREHLAAGRPIYMRERNTPIGHVIKTYPDGRRELVVPAADDAGDDVVVSALAAVDPRELFQR